MGVLSLTGFRCVLRLAGGIGVLLVLVGLA